MEDHDYIEDDIDEFILKPVVRKDAPGRPVKGTISNVMLWGLEKAPKSMLNDDKEDKKDKKGRPKKEEPKVEQKKTSYIDGEDYSIEDIEMLESEYDRYDEEIRKLYNKGNMDDAEELENIQEKISDLIDGLKAMKKMSGKGVKKTKVNKAEEVYNRILDNPDINKSSKEQLKRNTKNGKVLDLDDLLHFEKVELIDFSDSDEEEIKPTVKRTVKSTAKKSRPAKGSEEAKEIGKRLAEARKAKKAKMDEENKKNKKEVIEDDYKKEKGQPYYKIDKIPKGYREATEDEAIENNKVGKYGKYVVDKVKYTMFKDYGVLLTENQPLRIMIISNKGLENRIKKLLLKIEIEKNKDLIGKKNNYVELEEERKKLQSAYNWRLKVISKKTNIPYKKQKFVYTPPKCNEAKIKDIKYEVKDDYFKANPDPRKSNNDKKIYEFENDGKIYNLNTSYFDDDNKLIPKYAKKLYEKKVLLMPEFYTDDDLKKYFYKMVGGGILPNLKEIFKDFSWLKPVQRIAEAIGTNSLADWFDDDVGEYPRYVRKIIEDNADAIIVRMQVGRAPIYSAIHKLLSIFTLGKLDKRMERKGYDDLFHLRAIVYLNNGKSISLEKNERINMVVNEKPRSKEEEFIDIDLQGKEIMFKELLDNAKKALGDKYFKYSGHSNNCQDYVLSLLAGSDIGAPDDAEFIKQDVEELFRHYGFVKGLQDKVTNFAGKLNQLIYGEGLVKKRKKTKSRKPKIYKDVDDIDRTNNSSLQQYLTARKKKQEKEADKAMKDNIKLMADYIVKDVSAIKTRLGAGINNPSSWIDHVKSYAQQHNISYKQALKEAKGTYKK